MWSVVNVWRQRRNKEESGVDRANKARHECCCSNNIGLMAAVFTVWVHTVATVCTMPNNKFSLSLHSFPFRYMYSISYWNMNYCMVYVKWQGGCTQQKKQLCTGLGASVWLALNWRCCLYSENHGYFCCPLSLYICVTLIKMWSRV